MNSYTFATLCCCAAIAIYWMRMSSKTKAAVYRQSSTSRRIYLFFLALSFLIIYIPYPETGPLAHQIIPVNTLTGVIGAVIGVLGAAFAIWARYTLGTNWSGTVTLKKGHELVEK